MIAVAVLSGLGMGAVAAGVSGVALVWLLSSGARGSAALADRIRA